MDKVFMLNAAQAAAVLAVLADNKVEFYLDKPDVLSAVILLAGEGEYKYCAPTGGSLSGVIGEGIEPTWTLIGGKVNLIKTVRNATSWGLKAAKDFVDARAGTNINGDPIFHMQPHEFGWYDSYVRGYNKLRTICVENNVELRTR